MKEVMDDEEEYLDDELRFEVELVEADLRILERAAVVRSVASVFEWIGENIWHFAQPLAKTLNERASKMDGHIREKIIPYEIEQ